MTSRLAAAAPGAGLLPSDIVFFERGWLSSNNILLLGDDHAALVDSGYATQAAMTVELVTRGLGGRPLALLVNTHLHSDHCGGNAALQRRHPGLRTLVPPGLADKVRVWDTVALTYQPTGQQCERFAIDGVIRPGERLRLGLREWQVLAAPGHDPHAVVLFEPESRILISADALWEHGFGIVFPELEGASAFAEVGQTLDLIESLQPRVVIPGHGAVFTDVRGALVRARQRLAGFLADPRRHAHHAAKVLLKFRLLERQAVRIEEAVAWCQATPYFRMLHERWFRATPVGEWVVQLADNLVRSGAATRDGEVLMNA